MSGRIASINVDLDSVRCYEQIHGLLAATKTHCEVASRPGGEVYSTAIQRLTAWAQSLEVPITWFVVGSELEDETVRSRLARLHALGDELANHSEHHLYDLTARSREVMREEVTLTIERLRELTGERAFGFRAPGYRMTDELMAVLREADALYDSSVFPCPIYWAAKATVLLGQRLLGRQSRSILDHPKVLLGPRLPYRTSAQYLHRGDGLVELPVTVTPGLRLPFIGTSLVLAGRTGATGLAHWCRHQPFVNLELHGIDALDRGDGLEHLAKVQPDLRVPWQRKLEILGGAIQILKRAGFEFVTLREAATTLSLPA